MAKAQTMKPKSSVGDWLKGLMGGKTAKVPARAPSATSTVTNMPAAGGPAMRPAKAAGLAARGQAAAFPQLEDSRNQIAQYLKVLREGGEALGVTLPSAASNEELAGRLSDLEKRWPATDKNATLILAAQKDL